MLNITSAGSGRFFIVGCGCCGSVFFLSFVLVLIVEAGAADDEESYEQKYAGDDGENDIHDFKMV
jgi:hypothetical protein